MNQPQPTLLHSACRAEECMPALVTVPAGWFLMGSTIGQDNEKPVHRVWTDEFLLAIYQVTNADYARFLRDVAPAISAPPFWSEPAFSHPEQPVVGVSWYDATRYCEWLSGNTGQSFRLPTEAEWERAARGGREETLHPWGDAAPQSLSGYADRCAGFWNTGPEPVGLAEANAYGIYNMCDNVHEWCSDWYAAEYYAASPERNPRGPETGERRVSRGGSWRHHIKMSRCAARSSIPPEFKYADYGFRVACDVAKI
jgi:formylglycine-generating enzyme required for sulfatase activity